MATVGILRANVENLENLIGTLLDLIAYKPMKDRILLKPNLVVAESPEGGAITHPKVVEAIARYFLGMKKEVVIAEGTGIFSDEQSFERLLQNTGYGLIRERLGVDFINLMETDREEVPWRYGYIALPKFLNDYEYVNVPKMKTHNHTLVSLGAKNQKGLIPIETRKLFHKKGLHTCIYELSRAIKPSLTFVDALYCIEGTGPTGPPVGKTKKMDLLVAGKDMMAVDNVCSQIMGFNIKEIKHLRSVSEIEIVGEKIGNVRSKFERPAGDFTLGPFVVHMDLKACTMCTVSFYKAFSKIMNTLDLKQELASRSDPKQVHIVMGPAQVFVESESAVLCIGDCSAKTWRRMGFPLVRGCHPDYREIVNFLFPGYYPKV